MLYLVLFSFLIIALIDIKELLQLKTHKSRAFIIYGVLYLNSLILSVLLIIDKVPVSPSVFIENIINYIIGR